MIRWGFALSAVALAGLLGRFPTAQQSGATRTPIDISKRGPQAGQQAPDFSLKDQTGKVWTRQSLAGPKGAMLVFIRSPAWSPYCKTQPVERQSPLTELQGDDLRLA